MTRIYDALKGKVSDSRYFDLLLEFLERQKFFSSDVLQMLEK